MADDGSVILPLIDPDALVPFAPAPVFSSIVAEHLEPAAGAQEVIAQTVSAGRLAAAPNLEAAANSSIGYAAEQASAEANAPLYNPLPGALSAAQDGDQRRQAVLQYLPDPSTPIGEGFDTPPPLPSSTRPPPPDIQNAPEQREGAQQAPAPAPPHEIVITPGHGVGPETPSSAPPPSEATTPPPGEATTPPEAPQPATGQGGVLFPTPDEQQP